MSWTPDGNAKPAAAGPLMDASRADGPPRVAVLATGGTIAGVQTGQAGGAYRAGALSVQDLLAAVPGLDRLATLRAEQVASVGSQDMTAAIWHTLAARIREIADRDEADAVVLTHGTDTLEETAWFLELVLPPRLPVVLVGAMRPASSPGADGPANLRHAVVLAASARTAGSGPVVVMNEQIHAARSVRKISASGICSFASPGRGPLGVVAGDRVAMPAAPGTDPLAGRYAGLAGAALPRVDVVHAHVGQDPALVDWLVGRGARGLVLAGLGAGNASGPVLQALARAAAAGVPVVRASRTGGGLVGPGGEVDDAALGSIPAGDLSPCKARILLMLALAAGEDASGLRRCFAPN